MCLLGIYAFIVLCRYKSGGDRVSSGLQNVGGWVYFSHEKQLVPWYYLVGVFHFHEGTNAPLMEINAPFLQFYSFSSPQTHSRDHLHHLL